jgi:2-polyprenyl-3-methyl-5-hydroxy-6-metoxy-1,4-benzoquinol methylase
MRFRAFPSKEELEAMYPVPHDHMKWQDHIARINVTTALGCSFPLPRGAVIADLSCGNGKLGKDLAQFNNALLFLGDFAPGYPLQGPIEETLPVLKEKLDGRKIDLFICCETLEHLDNPDAVLADIHEVADRVLLSTPDGEKDDSNPEHIWAWDSEAIQLMIEEAGFTPKVHTILDLRPAGYMYSYQIWMVEA